MMDENAFKEVKSHKDDWRAALMAEVLNRTQEKESHFLTIIHQFDDTVENLPTDVPPLARLVGARIEDLPHVYLWNSQVDRTMPYPDKMNIEDVEKYSPDTMLAWCHVASLQAEQAALEEHIQEIVE